MVRRNSAPDLADLRRYAVARSLFKPTTLPAAIARLGFVQADPIRAPARAQDLTLRHRVKDYRAGDLERRYTRLAVEEDYFVNYGFLPRETLRWMHPRVPRKPWDASTQALAERVHDFVQARGRVHPREVQAALALGQTRNAWGGSSNTTTHLLDGMHYRGMLRVQRREQGLRVYESAQHCELEHSATECAQALLDLAVAKYAPLPARSLSQLSSYLRLGAPQLTREIQRVKNSATTRYASAEVNGQLWYWPSDENPLSARWRLDEEVRLLAPFDPIVWDRYRFEQFWGWAYRFEAYTPAPRRKLGYYALPMLWQGRVMGWGNLSVKEGRLLAEFGYLDRRQPEDPGFRSALDREMHRMAAFLGVEPC